MSDAQPQPLPSTRKRQVSRAKEAPRRSKPRLTAAQVLTALAEADVAPAPRGRGGRPRQDPALLEARGYYEHNPARRPASGPGSAPAAEDGAARDHAAIAERYADAVLSGAVVVGRYVRLAVERHRADLRRAATDPSWPYVFEAERANAFCAAAERYPHIKGRWAARGERLRLSDWQCFMLAVAFGWVRREGGLRRFREMFLFVARKNGKSSVAAAIGLNMLAFDGEHGAEVYSGATTEKQAWEVFGPARFMLSKVPKLAASASLEVWAKAIVKSDDNGKFWPVIGKPGDGSSPHCAIVDEYHEHPTSDLVDTMVTGMGAREQPMLVIITTAGTDIASPCYDKFAEARKVLEGVVTNEQLFALLFMPDEGDDWLSEAALLKANPNLDVSVDAEFLRAQRAQAATNSAYQNRFKTKHLNLWCNASVAGINSEQWRACADRALRLEQFAGEPMWAALDLASKIDICCYARIFVRTVEGAQHYYAFVAHYLPEQTIQEAAVNGLVYRKWVAAGALLSTPGAELDFDAVRDAVQADAARYMIQEVVYDPWRATQLAQQLAKDGAKVVEMGQTAKNMGEAYDELLSAIKGGRFHHDGDPVLEWMASNVVSKTVTKGLTLPSKDKRDQKIDGIVAVTMGISRAMAVEAHGWLTDPVMVTG